MSRIFGRIATVAFNFETTDEVGRDRLRRQTGILNMDGALRLRKMPESDSLGHTMRRAQAISEFS
jgi:hypothetical protein